MEDVEGKGFILEGEKRGSGFFFVWRVVRRKKCKGLLYPLQWTGLKLCM